MSADPPGPAQQPEADRAALAAWALAKARADSSASGRRPAMPANASAESPEGDRAALADRALAKAKAGGPASGRRPAAPENASAEADRAAVAAWALAKARADTSARGGRLAAPANGPAESSEADRDALADRALAQARGDALAASRRPAAPANDAESPESDRAALAAQALAKAKADALARGSRPATPANANFYITKSDGFDLAAGGQSGGGRPRRDDPAPLNAAIGGLVADAGWDLAVATGSVFGRWAQIVGPELAEHTKPEKLVDGELTVAADSTAWATQLRTFFAAELVRKLNVELGHGTVKKVRVLGPGAGSKQPGRWSVKGSRGPRDTYG